MIRYLQYLKSCAGCVLRGGRNYYLWMGGLFVLTFLGGISWYHHIADGLGITNMSNQVSWGIGIANFVYFVGVAASVALLIVPAYIYRIEEFKAVVVLAEIIAVISVVMCLSFIISDLGRPDRLLHLSPGLGVINLPSSHLAWDVMVFSVQLVLSLYIPAYLLYKRYLGQAPNLAFVLPPVMLSMLWAVIIHTVTAFLLSALKSRDFWNTGLLAPRFLVSAAVSGPAIILLCFAAINRYGGMRIADRVFDYLAHVLRVMLPVNLFLLGCEVFTELHSGTAVTESARYLFFGLGEHTLLPKFIWTAIVFDVVALVILLVPRWRQQPRLLYASCALLVFSIWVEKGMGLVLPGFTPSPLGEVVEYVPNASEIVLTIGILAAGALLFTAAAKVTIAVQTGRLRLQEGDA
ncbi:MAG: polysulfide reductase NrfD [Polyangiaceae bacterium]|nr:polysulfide reductase NrfD [Polyangiaceae bacterium]